MRRIASSQGHFATQEPAPSLVPRMLTLMPREARVHILLGALVGGLIGAAASVVMAKIQGRRITWGVVAGGFAGGAMAGAITATTFGASAIAAGGARALAFLAAEGASSSATGRVVENLVDGRPVMKDVAVAAAFGAAGAPLGYLGGQFTGRVVPAAIKEPVVQAFQRLPAPIKAGLGIPTARTPAVETETPGLVGALAGAGD